MDEAIMLVLSFVPTQSLKLTCELCNLSVKNVYIWSLIIYISHSLAKLRERQWECAFVCLQGREFFREAPSKPEVLITYSFKKRDMPIKSKSNRNIYDDRRIKKNTVDDDKNDLNLKTQKNRCIWSHKTVVIHKNVNTHSISWRFSSRGANARMLCSDISR